MKILICGSRYWVDSEAIYMYLLNLRNAEGKDFEVIEGGARGADTAARKAAEKLGVKVTTVHADWERLGRKAGPIRNRKMLDMLDGGNGDYVVAFHEDISKSRGTIDTVFEANRRGIAVEIRGRS